MYGSVFFLKTFYFSAHFAQKLYTRIFLAHFKFSLVAPQVLPRMALLLSKHYWTTAVSGAVRDPTNSINLIVFWPCPLRGATDNRQHKPGINQGLRPWPTHSYFSKSERTLIFVDSERTGFTGCIKISEYY